MGNPANQRLTPVLILLLLVSPALFAVEDISGAWAGTLVTSVDGKLAKTDSAHLALKQTGATVTGTAGPNRDVQTVAITNGKVETVKKDGKNVTNVTFTWGMSAPNKEAPAIHFVLTLVDGHLKGKGEAELEGRKLVLLLDAARLK